MKLVKLSLLILISLTLSFCLYGYYQNRSLDVEYQTIALDDLPQELDQLKIVHVSDTHFERNRISIETLLSEIEQAQPDLIFLTGDLIDRTADLSNVPLEEFGRSLSAQSTICGALVEVHTIPPCCPQNAFRSAAELI